MFDLRPLYNFDASEGQIPEGFASVYGPANSHANCVPASFTAVLDLLGLGDIDPQRVTNEIYGPNYLGGFGNFTRMIQWIRSNVPGAPTFSDTVFDFAAAEAAGQAGKLVVVAGWIDAASVTFTARALANGFSHASIIAAHGLGGKWVIWNTWTGQMQTYDQAVLAASFYEMSIAATGLFSTGSGVLGDDEDMKLLQHSPAAGGGVFAYGVEGARPIGQPESALISRLYPGITATIADGELDVIPRVAGSIDLKPILDHIDALIAHPVIATADPEVLDRVKSIQAALRNAGAAEAQA